MTAKGLSEREYEADVVIWPIPFTQASNDLFAALDTSIEANSIKAGDKNNQHIKKVRVVSTVAYHLSD